MCAELGPSLIGSCSQSTASSKSCTADNASIVLCWCWVWCDKTYYVQSTSQRLCTYCWGGGGGVPSLADVLSIRMLYGS